jgi:secreted PhoX family phosphatase
VTTTSEPSTEPTPAADRPAVSRRSFLGRTAAAGAGVALVGSVDTIFGAAPAQARPSIPRTPAGLIDVPLVPDPRGILALPPGFSYKIVAETGVTRLDSGQPTPADPDGTASFPRRGGGAVLVANHEVGGTEKNPVPAIPGFTYDPGAGGGTTNIEVDRRGNRVREYVSLAGTHNNCAGGVTPWGTWLTCEETEAIEGATGPYGVLTKRHGYVFEVDPADQNANRDPRPIKALGRYAHEAVAVDPHSGHFYLTEDAGNPNGLLYRWTPPRGFRGGKGALRRLGPTDGVLEAMRALDGNTHVPDLSVASRIGTRYRVEWVAVPDRDAATVPTRSQAYAKPITRSRKLEGMWWQEGEGFYFVASFARAGDGSAREHDGQVWLYRPGRNTIELKLTFAYTPNDQDNDPDGPDNITVAPFGGVIIAEDGEGAQHLIGALPTGDTFYLARNEVNDAEFAGPNISPDRSMLFANIQGDGSAGSPGYVFAILGPWSRFLP